MNALCDPKHPIWRLLNCVLILAVLGCLLAFNPNYKSGFSPAGDTTTIAGVGLAMLVTQSIKKMIEWIGKDE